MRLPNYEKTSVEGFFSIGFTHHCQILALTKDADERVYYIRRCYCEHLSVEALKRAIQADDYHHQDALPNNFAQTLGSPQQILRAVSMFKDEHLLVFIDVEELGVRDALDVDGRMLERGIVHNVKNFIMAFGRDFTFVGNQYHLDAFGEGQYIDLLFFNRELNCLVAVELKTGKFKISYLGQLSGYLSVLDGFVRKPHENPSIGLVLCKDVNKVFVDYIVQDYDKHMGGATVTEAILNGVSEERTAKVFDEDDGRRIIVCANKFQTGFDQPKLCAMYVDKMLTGVAAVQTLSRLNRCFDGKSTRVVDFVNDWDTIRASFADYYEATELDAVTDLSVIYDIKDRLDGFYVYDDADVRAVADLWYGEGNRDGVLRRIEACLAPQVDRWRALPESEAKLFKALLRKFLRNYSFITQMVALGDDELHRFFCYADMLVKKLLVKNDPRADLHGKVELEYLRLENMGTQSIKLQSEVLHNGAANAGVQRGEDQEPLSELVRRMNEAFGTDWNDADKIFHACTDKMLEDEKFVAQCRNNPMGDVAAVFGGVLMEALSTILAQSQEMAEAFAKNEGAYMNFLNANLLPYVYREANKQE